MNFRLTIFNILTFSLFIVLFFSSCNSTKHLSENQYLLRKNSININTNNRFLKKSDLIDQLQSFIIQKPNSYFPSIGLGISFPVKLYLYNFRYKKYAKDSNSLFIKNRIVNYSDDRNFPNKIGTSKLSPFIKFGQIHVETIWDECLSAKNKRIGTSKPSVSIKNQSTFS